MDQEKFGTLVEQLEGYAREHPTVYKIRVGLLAALGYLYLFVVVGLLLVFVYFVLAYVRLNWLILKAVWIPLVLVFIVLRSLWIRFPEPEGQHLKYEDAPALFDLVKEVESAVQSPHVHRILLTDDFNAAVVQQPRLGIFGWQKNYLLVGLLLVQGLSPEQFRAVIAHELGHLSGNHSRFAGWVYRVRVTWIQILMRLQQENRHGSFIFEWFLNWYAPFFNTYSFVLARAQEYEADAGAVKFAGREHTAKALINLEIKGRFLEEDFLSRFFRQADVEAEPPTDVFTQFVSALKHPVPADVAQKCYIRALAAPTGYEDTHPSLTDRLMAIGYPKLSEQNKEDRRQLLSLSESNRQNAAQSYLGPLADRFMLRCNPQWKEKVGQSWRERHRFIQEVQANLQQLQEKARTETLTLDEQWTLVNCLGETQGDEAALPKVREILNSHPDHVGANFALGQILLEQNDESGISYIERAMAKDQNAILSGCELIYFYLKEHGRDEEAELYRERAKQHYLTIARENPE